MAVVIGLLVVLYGVPATITGLKGKYGYLAVGVFIHVLWWIGAIRLAKPDSVWARRFYAPDKLDRAYVRFPTFTPQGQAAIARHMHGRLGKDGERVHTVADIAATLGVSRATAYRLLDLDQQPRIPRFPRDADVE
jgi:hypothetical protein